MGGTMETSVRVNEKTSGDDVALRVEDSTFGNNGGSVTSVTSFGSDEETWTSTSIGVDVSTNRLEESTPVLRLDVSLRGTSCPALRLDVSLTGTSCPAVAGDEGAVPLSRVSSSRGVKRPANADGDSDTCGEDDMMQEQDD